MVKQSFFADFQYDAQTTPEAHFRNVLYILCKLIGLQVDAEYRTSDGRVDLLIRTDKYVYIIECKIDSTARIALEQIRSKEYALPWAVDGREKILIGLNFSTKTRRPEEWVIATESDTQGDTQGDTQDDTQGDTQDDIQGDTQYDAQRVIGEDLDAWIKVQIGRNAKTTTKELAKMSGYSVATIKRRIAKMQDLRYVGSGYSGHWEINS